MGTLFESLVVFRDEIRLINVDQRRICVHISRLLSVGSVLEGVRYFGILGIRWGVLGGNPLIIRGCKVWRGAVPPVRSIISCRYRLGSYLFRFGRFCNKILHVYETHLDI